MKQIKLKKAIVLLLTVMLLVEMCPQKIYADEDYPYTYSAGTVVLNESKGEMLVGEVYWGNGDVKETAKRYKAKCKLNKAELLKQITPENINQLAVKVDCFGAAIEPINGNKIVISYIGAADKTKVKVNTSQEKQKLTVSIKGNSRHTFYINPSENERANTIKIGIPKKLFGKITINSETGSTWVSQTGARINGSSVSGTIIVKEETASKKITMETINGTVFVEGKQIKNDVSLKCVNGTARLEAGTVTGTVEMKTTNGEVELKAGTLSEAHLEASNGEVTAKADRLTGDTTAQVSNGSLKFHLTKEPKDLTLAVFGAGSKNKMPYSWKLPAGWKNGSAVGNGKPVLTLKAAVNGDLNFKIGK